MEYFNGDRVYIFELDDEKQIAKNTYELYAEGVASRKDSWQCVPYAHQEYSLQLLRRKENVCIENFDLLHVDHAAEKKILMNPSVHSLLLVPLWIADSLSGFMGVDNPGRNATHVDHLAALGDYMAMIILRRNNEARILRDNMVRIMMNA